MKRGTTPTLTLTVDADIVGWTIYASFRTNGKVYTFENDRLQMTAEDDVTTILLTLTQEETLAMHGSAEVQIRAIKDGTAIATDIQRVDVGRILKDGVIDELV
jgi:hypothetical protein